MFIKKSAENESNGNLYVNDKQEAWSGTGVDGIPEIYIRESVKIRDGWQ